MAFLLCSQNISQYLLDWNLCTQKDLEFLQIETLPLAKFFDLLIRLLKKRKLFLNKSVMVLMA